MDPNINLPNPSPTPPPTPNPAPRVINITPPSESPPAPNRWQNRRNLIFGLMGALVLVAGLTTSLVLVRRQQQIRSKASGCDQTCLDNGGTTEQCCGLNAGCTSDADCGPGGTCKPDGTCVVPPPPGTCWDGSNSNPCPPKPVTCDRSICPYGCWADGGCKGPPPSCASSGQACNASTSCCAGLTCLNGSCQAPPPPSAGGSCQTDAQCQAQHPGEENWVCTGAAGAKTCNQGPPGFSSCPGGTCSRFYGFTCTSLTNGICSNNPQTFPTETAGTSYAGNCGQVDLACNGGSKDGQLCGGYTVFTSGCGGPVVPPPPLPPPPPPPPPPPGVDCQCNSVVADKDLSSIKIGDTVTFTGFGWVNSDTDAVDKINFIIKKDSTTVTDDQLNTIRAAEKDSGGQRFWKALKAFTATEAGTFTVKIRVHWQSQNVWKE